MHANFHSNLSDMQSFMKIKFLANFYQQSFMKSGMQTFNYTTFHANVFFVL